MHINRKHRFLSVLLCAAVFMSFSFAMAFADSAAEKPEKKVVASASADQQDAEKKSFPPSEEAADESAEEAAEKSAEELAEEAAAKAETEKKQGELKINSKDSFIIDGEPGYEDDYIDWNGEDDFVLNKGENLTLDFSVYDTWKDYKTIPAFEVWSLEEDKLVFSYNPADSSLAVSADDWDNYSGQIDIGSADLAPGYYFLAIQAMPCGEDGAWAEDLTAFEIPEEYVDFTIK